MSIPHSLHWRDGRLWLHSGEGQFGYVDMDKGAFVPVAFFPGATCAGSSSCARSRWSACRSRAKTRPSAGSSSTRNWLSAR
ncbi:TIGR03032 family protein [Alteriqipengyuania lutimaris]|uniref:TIGR03032 family protein n=1 Tax=Alteriqipengyuania lutimaris TaxID=1538146 RepID=UPI001CFE0030